MALRRKAVDISPKHRRYKSLQPLSGQFRVSFVPIFVLFRPIKVLKSWRRFVNYILKDYIWFTSVKWRLHHQLTHSLGAVNCNSPSPSFLGVMTCLWANGIGFTFYIFMNIGQRQGGQPSFLKKNWLNCCGFQIKSLNLPSQQQK